MKKIILILLGYLFCHTLIAQPIPNKPQAQYEQAISLYQNKQLTHALESVNLAIAQRKEFIEAYLLRAKIKEGLNDINGAITDYSIVIYLDPMLKDAFFKRAQLYYNMERFEDALKDFHTVLNAPIGETTTVYFKGKTDADGFSSSNISTLQSDINSEIFNYVGLTHLGLENKDSAAYYFQQAINLKPNEADYYVNKGLLMEANLDTLSAIKAYQLALSLNIDHAIALGNLAKLTKQSQYQTLVSETYDIAVEEQGTYQAYFNRGIMFQSKNMHHDAIIDFNEAIRIGGKHEEVLLMRGFSKEKLTDMDGAIEDYTEVLRFNPSIKSAYINRANVQYKLKNYQEAIADYTTAINIDSNDPKIYYNRGLAHFLAGHKSNACQDLYKALEMNFTAAQEAIQSYCLNP